MNKPNQIVQQPGQSRPISLTQMNMPQMLTPMGSQFGQKVPSPVAYNKLQQPQGQQYGAITQYNQLVKQSPTNQVAPQFVNTPTRLNTSPSTLHKTYLSDYNILGNKNPIFLNQLQVLPQSQYQMAPSTTTNQKQIIYNQPGDQVRQNRYFSTTYINQTQSIQNMKPVVQPGAQIQAQNLPSNLTPAQPIQFSGLNSYSFYSATNTVTDANKQLLAPGQNPNLLSPQRITYITSPLRPQIDSRHSSLSPQIRGATFQTVLSPGKQNFVNLNSPSIHQLKPTAVPTLDPKKMSPSNVQQQQSKSNHNSRPPSQKATPKTSNDFVTDRYLKNNAHEAPQISLSPSPKREQIKDYLIKNSPKYSINQQLQKMQGQELRGSAGQNQFQINNPSKKSKQDRYKQSNPQSQEKVFSAEKVEQGQTESKAISSSRARKSIDVTTQIDSIVKTVNNILNEQIDRYYIQEKQKEMETKSTVSRQLPPTHSSLSQQDAKATQSYEENIRYLQGLLAKQNEENDRLKSKVGQLESTLDENKKTIRELEAQVSQSRSMFGSFGQADVIPVTGHTKKKSAELQDFLKEKQAYIEEIDRLKKDIRELEESKGEPGDNQVADLNKQIEQLNNEKDELEIMNKLQEKDFQERLYAKDQEMAEQIEQIKQQMRNDMETQEQLDKFNLMQRIQQLEKQNYELEYARSQSEQQE